MLELEQALAKKTDEVAIAYHRIGILEKDLGKIGELESRLASLHKELQKEQKLNVLLAGKKVFMQPRLMLCPT
jgi:hypothetical protein